MIEAWKTGICVTDEQWHIGVRFNSEGYDETQHDFIIHYIQHNGYTRIEGTNGREFCKWLNLFNTRYQRQHQSKIKLFRKHRLIKWAKITLERAYGDYLLETAQLKENL